MFVFDDMRLGGISKVRVYFGYRKSFMAFEMYNLSNPTNFAHRKTFEKKSVK